MNDKSKFPEVTRGERTKATGRVIKPVLKLTGYYTDSNQNMHMCVLKLANQVVKTKYI